MIFSFSMAGLIKTEYYFNGNTLHEWVYNVNA